MVKHSFCLLTVTKLHFIEKTPITNKRYPFWIAFIFSYEMSSSDHVLRTKISIASPKDSFWLYCIRFYLIFNCLYLFHLFIMFLEVKPFSRQWHQASNTSSNNKRTPFSGLVSTSEKEVPD